MKYSDSMQGRRIAQEGVLRAGLKAFDILINAVKTVHPRDEILQKVKPLIGGGHAPMTDNMPPRLDAVVILDVCHVPTWIQGLMIITINEVIVYGLSPLLNFLIAIMFPFFCFLTSECRKQFGISSFWWSRTYLCMKRPRLLTWCYQPRA